MIPIVFVWTNFTAQVKGQTIKLVPCEECHNEYVYLLKREGMGAGTSYYGINSESASENAVTGAHEILDQYLTNDFDPVPCPVCGHYQRFMFPKLFSTQSLWFLVAVMGALCSIVFFAISSIYWSIESWTNPSTLSLGILAGSLAMFALALLIGLRLRAGERRRAESFDPNTLEDRQSRINEGRKRAKTRAEFETANYDTRSLDYQLS